QADPVHRLDLADRLREDGGDATLDREMLLQVGDPEELPCPAVGGGRRRGLDGLRHACAPLSPAVAPPLATTPASGAAPPAPGSTPPGTARAAWPPSGDASSSAAIFRRSSGSM